MTGRRRLGLVAASATLLAAAPISSIFDSWTWLLECILAVGFIAGAALLARTLRFPVWALVLSMIGMLLLALTWMFPGGDELAALLPTPSTLSHFGQLMAQAGSDTRSYGVPVPDRDGLLFITVLGIGSVAILVDVLTVVMRRPALAGLPMLAIYSVPVAVYIDDVPVMPFIIGSVGFLWLLVADNVDRVRRFGRRFTGDGRDVDVWEPSPLAAAGRRLAIIGVAAAVLLPLAIPGITTGLLSQLTQTGTGVGGVGGGPGRGGRINLFASLSGQLTQTDTKELIRVTTNEPSPFYLRVGVADAVTDQGFTSRSNSGRSIRNPFPDPRTDAATDGATYQEYRATIENTGLDQSLAPIYSITTDVKDLDGPWYYDNSAQAVYSPRTTTKGRKYTIDYVRAVFTPDQLKTAQPLGRSNPLQTELTRVPTDDAVVKLVNRLIQGKGTEYGKVRAIYDYFSRENGFTYSLQTQTGTSGTELEAFLKNKAGFCQQYAAAMAWMVRVAGIPARVAFGFTRGGAKDGNTYVITNRNAHAWTEVYFSGFGWVPFDATPAASIVGASRFTWAPDTDHPAATPSSSSDVTLPGTDPSAAAQNAQRPDNAFGGDKGLAGAGATASVSGSRTALLVVTIAALVIAMLLVPSVRRALMRRRRYHATVPKTAVVAAGPAPPGSREVVVTMEAVRARHDAHAAWDELIDTMIDFRVPVDPTETPRHTAQRLVRDADLTEAPARSATLLGSAEERARYAREPLQGGELTPALAQVRKGLSRTATRRARLAAVLMPPSVLLRWRLGLADASARWVGTFGRIRDVLARWSPRRLLTSRSRG
jgi:transglutaminase-like putative cysteine protease